MGKIKAIIFDLDDTLYDQEQIRDTAREQSIRAMIDKGLNCSIEQAMNKLKEITPKTHASERFKKLAEYFNCYDNSIAEAGRQKYINSDFKELILYPETIEVLEELKRKKLKLILITEGSITQQNKKINALGIRYHFNKIYISKGDKTEFFKNILKTDNLLPEEVLCVGDRINKELSVGKKLGLKTARLLKGVYSNQIPENEFEKPDFAINNLIEIPGIIDRINDSTVLKKDTKGNIKNIIFDLDNTLWDTEKLVEKVAPQAIQAMINAGLNCNLEQGLAKFKEWITEKDKFERIIDFFGPKDQRILEIGKNKYYKHAEFDTLEPFPGVIETLSKLKQNYRLFLLTQGEESQQIRKIKALRTESFFEKIFFAPVEKKEETFNQILQIPDLNPKETLVVGDRINKEIKLANESGMKTIRILKGKYSSLQPTEVNEKPDFVINEIPEILNIINIINNKQESEAKLDKSSHDILSLSDTSKTLGKEGELNLGRVGGSNISNNISKKQLKIVTIGGGTGTSPLLEGLKQHTDDLTAIVTVTDTGRSTGRLRKDLNMLAPGDMRNCLIALANSEELMYDLFQYRFDNGDLEGYSFGNLLIAALTKITGSFEKAIEEASKILELKGKVIPATLDNINICAVLEDGTILNEEDKIIDRHNPDVFLRSPIKKVFHSPTARPNEKALKTIEQADLIVFSPGSLFTSIISNLLVEGIPEAINKSNAKKIYVCNIMSQQCQTHSYKASDHIKQLIKYLNGKIDHIILNTQKPNQELIETYEKEHAHLIENDINEIQKLGINTISENVLDETIGKKILWHKKDLLRHHPDKIAEVVMRLVEG